MFRDMLLMSLRLSLLKKGMFFLAFARRSCLANGTNKPEWTMTDFTECTYEEFLSVFYGVCTGFLSSKLVTSLVAAVNILFLLNIFKNLILLKNYSFMIFLL